MERRPASARRTQAERVEESTRRLLDAALELVAEQGFERTTAAEIGQRAGYSRNMVRDRFGGKDQLLEALLERELRARLLPALGRRREDSGLDQLLGQVDDLAAAARGATGGLRAIMMLTFEAAHAESVRRWYARTIERVRVALVDQLSRGQADGSVRPDLDVDREAEDYISHALGVFFRWTLFPDDIDLPGEILAWRSRLRRTFASRAVAG